MHLKLIAGSPCAGERALRVRLRYWNRIRNCGDAVMSYVVQNVLNATPVQVTARQSHLLGVGSIFFMAKPNSFVWGSGMLRPYDEIPNVPSENIRAVRGRLTLKHLQSLRPGIGNLPLGDPGIFADELLAGDTVHPPSARFRAAVVPHYRSAGKEIYREHAQADDVVVVDMRDDSLQPLRAIRDSEVVISQSLHGLVFATALGKPCIWISHNTEDHWCFKFRDWFSTVDNPQDTPLRPDCGLDELIKACEHRFSTIDRTALLSVFPWDEVSYNDGNPLLDFESVRAMTPALLRLDWAPGPAVSRDWYREDETRTRALNGTIRGLNKLIAAHWAETPYICLAPEKLQIERRILVELAAFMDRHTNAEALLVMPPGLLSPAQVQEMKPALTTNSMQVSKSSPWIGGALFLRPTVKFSLESVTWTVILAKNES